MLANALLLGIAVVTSLRSRVAFQAWVFFALCYLINQGVLGRGRVGLIGPHMGTLLRYQLENTVLFCIALAVAIPYLRGAWPARWVPRVRGRAVSRPAAVDALVALGYLLVSGTSLALVWLATGDGRSTEIALTELASERLRVYDASAEHVLVGALERLGPDGVDALRAALPVLAELRLAIDEPGA